MASKTNYTTRSLRRRRNSDQWECSLSHKDPVTGEVVRTYHTLEANTQRQAERARDALILELERKGGAVAGAMTLREFMDAFLRYKAASGTIEPSTVRSYRGESSQLCRYLGNVPVASLTVADVDGWMRDMSADGYAPKSVAKPFHLLKQALKWGQAQDLVAKNVCDFCKPPKRVKTPINALCREERTRMLALAVRAQPEPLGLAVELALTTGMRRGEVCALRWSDLGDDGTITVSHALGNGPGGFYLKEPKTGSSARIVASYLGHASVSMTLDIYADVDPEAKRAAVSKVEDSFDFGLGGIGDVSFLDAQDAALGANVQIAAPGAASAPPVPGVTFTVEQLEAMLDAAKAQEAANA